MIRLVSAGAGSGKTYRLTEEIADAVGKRNVPPECVVATTFTVKAANEIKERVRAKLLKQGLGEKAQAMADSHVGTVHSICGRLLSTFCFQAGLSPDATIMPEDEAIRLFQAAVSEVIEAGSIRLGGTLRRLSMDVDIRSKRKKKGAALEIDWRENVRRVISFARANGLAANQLPDFADRSWRSLQALLPLPLADRPEELDARLVDAIREALPMLELKRKEGDKTQATEKVIATLRRLEYSLRRPEELTWSDWEGLANVATGAKSRSLVEPIQEAASLNAMHPRFHEDLENYIKETFACAALAMEHYASYKSAHGLMDFEDQESLALALLRRRDEDVRDGLREMIKLVLVDEFQDTNPIQLAIFLELASIAPESIWVGDQKQSIFGFRGTDPRLMDAVIEKVVAPGDFDILPSNWRSQAALIEFFNAFFSQAFARYGLEEKRVALEPRREDSPLGMTPLQLWKLQCAKAEEEFSALASGVADMLTRSETIQVFDKKTSKSRTLRAGDIAILCRTNPDTELVAAELGKRGIRTSLGGDGLLQKPECVIAMASLRYLVNARDTEALAELAHYSGIAPSQWLSALLDGKQETLVEACPGITALNEARSQLVRLTPGETLDVACEAMRLDVLMHAWGEVKRRKRNIEQLRGLALAYEDACRARRSACTAVGLIGFLLDPTNIEKMSATENVDEHAVAVMTYHKSKGLEWPVVILTGLDATPKARVFGVFSEPSPEPFDPEAPLKGRWIRCWPWPYGKKKKCSFDEQIESSPEQINALDNEQRERLRLLYVGMTRARDYLVLSAKEKKNVLHLGWLDAALNADNPQTLAFEENNGKSLCRIADSEHRIEMRTFAPGAGLVEQRLQTSRLFTATERPKTTFPPASLSPSRAEALESPVTVVLHALGERLLHAGVSDMTDLGEAVHSFFCIDRNEAPLEDRIGNARSILTRWRVRAFEPEKLVIAADRLSAFLTHRFGEIMSIRREWPLQLRLGNQHVSGWIDMLVETSHGWVIVDHKSFPGPRNDLQDRAQRYAPQLNLYSQAITTAFGTPPREMLLHFPLVGAALSVGI